jgi:hypothetical protein
MRQGIFPIRRRENLFTHPKSFVRPFAFGLHVEIPERDEDRSDPSSFDSSNCGFGKTRQQGPGHLRTNGAIRFHVFWSESDWRRDL